MISKSSVRNASKRLLKNNYDRAADRQIIRQFRDFISSDIHDRFLDITTLAHDLHALCTSRVKRIAAIERKILREEITAESMDDIVGLRFLVDGPSSQDQLVSRLVSHSDFHNIRDYRIKAGRGGYRGVHVVHRIDATEPAPHTRLAEIQVRTWAQHLWASISEALGQRIKEGAGNASLRTELHELSEALYSADADDSLPTYGRSIDAQYFLLRVILRPFRASCQPLGTQMSTGDAQLILNGQEREIAESGNEEAVLLLSRAENDVRSTHVRFFPFTLLAHIRENFGLRLPPKIGQAMEDSLAT